MTVYVTAAVVTSLLFGAAAAWSARAMLRARDREPWTAHTARAGTALALAVVAHTATSGLLLV